MDTAAISYRVVDFLKKYPPFHVMEEGDLLEFARRGRVKFFETNQYVLLQGTPRVQVLVIQQGTVLLWDERGSEARLLDVRGAGDMVGIDQFNDAPANPYAARSASDVLIYAFPADHFRTLTEQYPYAGQYVSAYGSVRADYRSAQELRDPQNVFLHELAARERPPVCDIGASIGEAAQQMLTTQSEAIVVLDSKQQARSVLTARSFLKWAAAGGGDARDPVAALFDGAPLTIAPDASVADGVLAMGAANAGALAITSDGTVNSGVRAIVASHALGQVFGDRPLEILHEISRAVDTRALRELNQRARSFVLRYLIAAASSEWLARFTSAVDRNIVKRIIAMAAPEAVPACWCFCGPSGRGESLTRLLPQIVMIADDAHDSSHWRDAYQRVSELLDECGYLPNAGGPFEPLFYADTVAEWKKRYTDWVGDPILKQIYQARPLFDLRPIVGDESIGREIEDTVTAAINREFLHVMANDCLATLPPLTFFQDAVVDESGEETAVFRLEDTTLRPLVDVGRVFGMASRKQFGSSTLERFAMARTLVPEHASIFQEASETMRMVLWQQGRVGITQDTAGSELPPALLGRYDRQILRSGFRSILRLLEFTADMEWLKACD